MSFDLGVWHSEQPLTDAEAADIYLRLCEEWPYLEGEQPTVKAFYEELIQHWPEIDTIPEEKVGDFDFCPWSCELNHSGRAVVMSCVWSKANEVAEYVRALARKHRLLFFDPQANRVMLPEQLSPPNAAIQMDDAINTERAFRLLLLWVAIGFALEFLIIPNELHPRHALLSSGDFYYALLSPVVIWWFFRRLVPAKERELREFGIKGVRLMNLILGFYTASALRAIFTAFFSIHLGLWSVNTR